MSGFGYELRQALASLRRAPGFVATVALTLGLTLGALVCMFGINRLLFMAPLPYPDQQRLVVAQGVVLDQGQEAFRGLHTYPALMQLYQQGGVFERAAVLNFGKAFLTSDPNQPRLNVTYASSGLFDLTGAPLKLGRAFQQGEEVGASTPSAMLSYQAWATQFGSDPSIVGRKISVDSASYTVVGVLAKDYAEPQLHSLERSTDIYLPWELNPRDKQAREDWENFDSNIMLVGRLAAGTTPEQAAAALTEPLNRRFRAQTAGIGQFATITVEVAMVSFAQAITGDSKRVALMLLAGVAALLLIAAANVSNLFLARTAQKQRQLSIQATLGANRGHLFRTMFTESAVVMGIAGLAAAGVAALCFGLLQRFAQGKVPRLAELGLDGWSLGFVLLAALLLALVFAALSIRMVNYRALAAALQSGGKGSGLQVSQTTRKVLIASQIAVAAVLLVANFGLLKESLAVLMRPAGFDTQDLYELTLNEGERGLSPEEKQQQLASIGAELRAWPNVAGVAVAGTGPTSTSVWATTLLRELGGNEKFKTNSNRVDADYFNLIGLPMAEGRSFSAQESRERAPLIVVNETLAKAINPDGSALGATLYWNKNTEPFRVIGVVRDVFLPTVPPAQRLYLPGPAELNLVVKVKPGQQLDQAAVVAMLAKVNTSLRINKLAPVQQTYRSLLARDITTAAITGLLTVLALFLAGVGVYGVLSYSIKLRRHELGIRMAIGASPRRIAGLVYRDSLRPVAWGFGISAVAGVLLYLFARQQLDSVLQLGAWPPVLSVLLIMLTVLLACWLPLRAILREWPVRSLRGDGAL